MGARQRVARGALFRDLQAHVLELAQQLRCFGLIELLHALRASCQHFL